MEDWKHGRKERQPSNLPTFQLSNFDWLAHQARAHPKGIALIHGDQHWTYAELNELVAGLASRLAAAGVEAGQHIAVLMPNRVETIVLIHALARLGTVLVPLNTRLTPAELRWQMTQADCHYLICSEESADQVIAIGPSAWQVLSIEESRVQSGLLKIEDLAQWRSRPLNLAATQAIVYTSGTTGQPKGAMLTFANHLWSAMASAFRLGTNPTDRWLLCLPLYHVGGLAIVLRCCLYGTTLVLQERFDPAAINQMLDTQAISLISLVPTMLQWLLEARQNRPLPPTLRCILLGGMAAPSSLLEQCHALALPVATTYGLTEAASQVATASPAEAQRKPGSVGKPLMFTEVCIVGQDGGECLLGEIGQIVVRGPTLMRGYYNQPDATAQVLRNGELYTGDLGYLDQDGDLWVVQRRADLIVSGGENVYPAEVEQVLLTHPAVQAACVVGVEDAEWGQRVAAAVIIRDGASLTTDELMAFCRVRLAGYKQPRLLRFVDALPQTGSGKIQREAVARLMATVASRSEA
jgi:O-succinylbenzoic acid--CoA ligase